MYALPQCGGPRILREVALHGPRSTRRYLADYVRQHLLLYCQEMVVAYRSLCRGCGHRPSLRHYLPRDGHCLRGGATVPGIFRVEISRPPLCAAGALRARQQYAGNCVDGADGDLVCRAESDEQFDLGVGTLPASGAWRDTGRGNRDAVPMVLSISGPGWQIRCDQA